MKWPTHEVTNQTPVFENINLFAADLALLHSVRHEGASWHEQTLQRQGAELGSSQTLQLGTLANQHPPELNTHDRFGRRIDQVDFHPSWHSLLGMLRREGMHALPWAEPRAGAHVARAASYFLFAQVEAGSLCPTTMTFAAIPVLRQEPELFSILQPKLFSYEYDSRDVPIEHKQAISIGMGMTEKQGGSDVRSNTTQARAIGKTGRGKEYVLTGHKWFFSAPMCDAHLVLAQTNGGLSCFFVPRWRLDGIKNAVLIQRLKDKLGNRSNASSEVEFQDALGIMVGNEGHGVRTIIQMANYTRLDCVIGSAGLMRNALVQALHHARHRKAFGRLLIEQPLMRHVLMDLALESEAATFLMLRLARAFDAADDPLEQAWRRIMTPAAKFWICKRAIEFCAECMEVCGGNGYVETGPMARIYREAPVNSIWEGSGNVMCLDVLRAIQQEPEGFAHILKQLDGHQELKPLTKALRDDLSQPQGEPLARRIVQRLVFAQQADLMLQHAPNDVAQAFVQSRINDGCGRIFGSMSPIGQCAILERAWVE